MLWFSKILHLYTTLMTLWKLEYIVYKQQIANRLFPSCLLPLCENKPSCEAIIWKCVSPTCSFSCKSNTFSYESFCTKTRFETEAQANSKMAYYMNIISNLLTHVLEIDQCLNSSKLENITTSNIILIMLQGHSTVFCPWMSVLKKSSS